MTKYNDLTGHKYNRLTVLSRVINNKSGKTIWKCRCDCGNTSSVVSSKLKKGYTKSCGCINKERMAEISRKRKGKRHNRKCKLKACNDRATSKGYCGKHYARIIRTGSTEITRRPNGTGNINKDGYIDICINGRRTYEHILVAEKVLGKRLPKKALIHHINKNRQDNRKTNLVICPDEKYHKLLHRRQKEKNWYGEPV